MRQKTITAIFFLLLILLTFSKMRAQNNDYVEMIASANRAPSGHNTQPWKFRVNDGKIEIIPDFGKTLPIVDSDNRELFISLGCAAENLCINATILGYQSDMDITDDGTISIHLFQADDVEPDILNDQIEIRQTNRNVYEYKNVADSVLNECLLSIPEEDNIHVYHWANGSSEFEVLKQYIIKGNTIQMENKEFVLELKSWMRMNKKESETTKDGLSYDVFGAPNLPKFIAKPIIGSFLNSKKQNKGDGRKIESSSHFVLFTSKRDNHYDWITLGRCLQRFLLKSAEQQIAHTYMNQPCEVKELRLKLKSEFAINNEYPQILLRIGYAPKAPYSKRKNINDIIIEE